MKSLAIVIPAHNEAESLPVFIERLAAVLAELPWMTTAYIVNDGSTDQTVEIVRQLQRQNSWLSLINLTRNFGHQAALEAGLMQSKADATICLDADCQHPPEEIPNMLAAFTEGYDIVQMTRHKPAKGLKGFLSKKFYQLFNKITDTNITPDGADFRLLSKNVIEVLKQIPERKKFLRALLPSLGFKQKVLQYQEELRQAGTSSYTFSVSKHLASKAIFEFSTVPLKIVFYLGMFLMLVSFSYGLFHVVNKLINGRSIMPGFTDIIASVLFLSGCILGSIGIIGRYVIIILDQVRGRPSYLIANIEQSNQSSFLKKLSNIKAKTHESNFSQR